MLYNYKKYTQILESKNFDKKVEKQKNKIREFLKSETIIDWIFDKFVSEPREGSTNIDSGLKYTVWLANTLKKDIIKELIKTTKLKNSELNDLMSFAPNVGNLNITDEKLKPYFYYFLTNGKLSDNGKWDFNWSLDEKKLPDVINKQIKWQLSSGQHNDLLELKDWLKSPVREEKINLKTLTLKDAIEKSTEWHKSLKASGIVSNEDGEVIMTFEDGWYWIDLKSNQCRAEADAMGHCATTDADTLLSLRHKQSPHVTVAFNYVREMDFADSPNGSTILQIKGRNNERPKEKYHPYILQLLSAPNVKEGVKLFDNDPEFEYFPIVEFQLGEWESNKDFHLSDLNKEQLTYLSKNNIELFKNIDIGTKFSLVEAEGLDLEKFVSEYKDLVIVDGEVHFIIDGFGVFDKDIYKTDNDHRDNWQFNTLSGDGYQYFEDYESKFDYKYSWDKLNTKAHNEIIKFLDGNVINYETVNKETDERLEQSLILTPTNMKVEGDDIFIYVAKKIELSKLLDDEYYDTTYVDKNNVNYSIEFDSNELDDLRDKLDHGYQRAKTLANENEAYNAITDAILDFIGPIVTPKDSKWYPDNKIHIKLNFKNIGDIDSGDYNSVLDIIDNGLNNEDETGNEGIDVDVPYYGWSGDVNAEDLIEEISNLLYE